MILIIFLSKTYPIKVICRMELTLAWCGSLNVVLLCAFNLKAGVEAGGTFFERLMCLAVTVESSPVLSCIALWMQVWAIAHCTPFVLS